MGQIVLEDILVIIQIILLLFFVIRLVERRDTTRSMTALLFVFGSATYIITDLYWLAHLLVKAGATPLFSAAEIGIAGVFLLYGAALSVSGNNESGIEPKQLSLPVIAAILFTAANTACWYGWNGGWIRDLITGVSMAYFLVVIVAGLYEREALSKKGWIITGILAATLMAFEAGSIFATGTWVPVLEVCRYTLWVAGLVFIIIKMRQVWHSDAQKALFFSFALFLWSVFILYLSSNTIYDIIAILVDVCLVPMYLMIRKEASEE